ncbi:MAG: class I adenylate-forming enzyme family protein [Gammaproteobacteria bacterium]|nr:class I adenylate-forming enzyme family protein [Gammaproteobacteria bacterium]
MYDQLREVWTELTAPGAPFEITEVEVRGITIKTYATAPSSLREVWLSSSQFADRDYLVYEDERWTYAEAHRDVAAVANWLQAQGVRPGDHVAIAMRNYPEWLITYWATVSIGGVVVGMNAWWVWPEMAFALTDAKPKVLVCDAERLEPVLANRNEIDDVTLVAVRMSDVPRDVVRWSDIISLGGEMPAVTVDPDGDACIFYTSGTTGQPKGALLTHRGCVANILSLGFWAAVLGALAERKGQPPQDPATTLTPAALVTTPLFHVTANNCVAHGNTLAGGKLVHMYKWDAGAALKLIEQEKITVLTGVPVMARELISHPDFASTDTSSLLSVGGGGAQLQPDLVAKIDASVASARPNTGYGMTETCGIITSISADFFVDKPDSCGPALPVYDVKCVDSDDNTVAQGEVGELLVKGAQVIRGYLNREEATEESISDGWLRTGDIARIDEHGFIYIVDRVKDMVLRGGENVYCAEVENAIFDHPAVAETTVFGVPDTRLGEEVGAAVYLSTDASAEDIRAHCRTLIAKHKIPRYIWFASEPLPKNANGKFMKRELRETLDVADAV